MGKSLTTTETRVVSCQLIFHVYRGQYRDGFIAGVSNPGLPSSKPTTTTSLRPWSVNAPLDHTQPSWRAFALPRLPSSTLCWAQNSGSSSGATPGLHNYGLATRIFWHPDVSRNHQALPWGLAEEAHGLNVPGAPPTYTVDNLILCWK